jgi:hypothetical protein
VNAPTATAVPTVGAFTIAPTRFRRGRRAASISRAKSPTGATIAFTLSSAATVTLGFEQSRPGIRLGKRCVSPGKAHLHGRACTSHVPVAHTIVREGHPGVDRIHFEGVLDAGFRLAPGSYRLSLSAANAGGTSSAAQRPGFTLLP